MSFAENKTFELWRDFMPERKYISKSIGRDLYSVEIYDSLFFAPFQPGKEFEKWAAVEVTDQENLPPNMEALTLPGGLYAVFLYKGAASEAFHTYRYIFESWLPSSAYALDDRPHFALMGANYKKDHPSSEEEIWIPVKPK